MEIISTQELNLEQKGAILQLWNQEYPAQLQFQNPDELDIYLNHLKNQFHYFVMSENIQIIGWAFTFEREGEKWFAMILDSVIHGKGVGRTLLTILKEHEPALNGWAIDHTRYIKQNSKPYLSPLNFYIKNGFTVCPELRLETEKLSAVKIRYTFEK